jgi:hypothetical protein
VDNPEPSLAWTPPAGWPAPPQGWVRRNSTAIVLVGFSSTVALLYGTYGIVNLSLEARALHSLHGWHQPLSPNAGLILFMVWFYSMALLIPAAAIGASELFRQGRSRRARAVAFGALLCVGMVGQYWADQRALSPSRIVSGAWLHDGRSWFALMCALATVVFVGAVALLKSTSDTTGAPAAFGGGLNG